MSLTWPTAPATARGGSLTRVPRPQPAKAGLTPGADGIGPLADRVRAEYLEMPGLSLTRAQAQCLWNLDAEVCDGVLAHLVEKGFLVCRANGTFTRIE